MQVALGDTPHQAPAVAGEEVYLEVVLEDLREVRVADQRQDEAKENTWAVLPLHTVHEHILASRQRRRDQLYRFLEVLRSEIVDSWTP